MPRGLLTSAFNHVHLPEYSLPSWKAPTALSTSLAALSGEAPLSLPSPVDYCIYLVVFPVLLLLISFIISSSKYFQVFWKATTVSYFISVSLIPKELKSWISVYQIEQKSIIDSGSIKSMKALLSYTVSFESKLILMIHTNLLIWSTVMPLL